MQNAEIFYKACKNAFTRKEYIFPSGRKEFVLGYEDKCLDCLLEIYCEDDIIVDPRLIPTFKYEKLRDDGTIYSAKYFPDVLIVNDHGNYFIEVKSEWTYKIDTVNIHKKIKSVTESGYDIELWIYNSKKNSKKRTF
ncbi:273R [Invertebrate iridescent virus Kaz2018]|uniref:Uncharacterized protein 273R n=1 Tax=Invertebrate iridescent virus 6 TaxID=176652 RepID=273R_IIV6|nr:273R [Invertebrate iridescent virus 6]Q91FQ0.1 RecName: Full=Uncharacterized protein 273R [Invertebrate iridescent virus 6]AAK82134.1 273R [Invertebrate iridescent virus 6]QNH08683.1 273R [Invertebrate iridescent virus Kaz2018]